MPVLKPITGHTSCKGPFFYLTKGGRALASDYINLDVPSNAARGGVFPWYKEMDETRECAGHNRPWGGRPPRTYMHYIVSPNPEDGIGIAMLRDLATAWAKKHFGDYQCAIVYHDDNERGIPHAHVIVNFTNLAMGRKLHIDDPTSLSNSLQALAEERGLGHFCDSQEIRHDADRLKFVSKTQRPKSYQQEYERRAEVQLKREGAYSWVADIRARVKVARSVACSEAEFRSLLDELGVQVSDNSAKAARADWIYSLKDAPTKRVSGEKLGLAYGREHLLSRFGGEAKAMLPAAYGQRMADIARHALEVRDLSQLRRLSDAVTLIERGQIRSTLALEAYMQRPHERKAWNDLTQEEAAAAGELIRQEKMLPFRTRGKPARTPIKSEDAYAATRPQRRSEAHADDSRMPQRDRAREAPARQRSRNDQER